MRKEFRQMLAQSALQFRRVRNTLCLSSFGWFHLERQPSLAGLVSLLICATLSGRMQGTNPFERKKKTHSVNPTRQLQSELGHLSNLICKIYLERRYENVQAADGIGFALEPLLEG